jgi:polysaccharide deacetylase 2 family uncharacterized protein YibQ
LSQRDPLLEAIARYPAPLIMTVVGLVGMPLTLWLFTPERAPARLDTPVVISASATPTATPTGTPVAATAAATQDIALALPEQSPADTLTVDTPASAEPAIPAEPAAAELLEEAPATAPASTTETLSAPTSANPAPSPAQSFVPAPGTHYIALIIDDIGYVDDLGARAVALPDDVTFAVLPHTPHGVALAEAAHANGKEVMLHAPMSNLAAMPLGPGGLTPQLTREEFMQTLTAALDAVPHLQGLNNHMGSELTAQEEPMRWVMETLQRRNLYFVDSYTTASSVAGRIAQEQDIPTLTRNVFLDNVQTAEDIDREFQRLLTLAREKGFATGIGHPYAATLDYLEKALPTLTALHIELIPVSQMIALQRQATGAW